VGRIGARFACVATWVVACGCGRIAFDEARSGDGGGSGAIVLDPPTATINLGARVELTVTDGTPPFTFTATGGGWVDAEGTFTAPVRAGSSQVRVTDSVGNAATAAIRYEGSRLYLAGGDAAGARTDQVRSSTDGVAWSVVGHLPAPRANGALIAYEDRLLYLGGLDVNAIPTNDVFASSDGATWTPIGQLPDRLSALGITVHAGELWLAGGNSAGSGNVADVYRSRDAITWSRVGALPMTVHEHDLISREGQLVVLGGHADSGFVDTILTSTDGASWSTSATRLTFGTDFPTVGELGDRIVRACGSDCTATETSTDLTTWTPSTFPGGVRSGAALVGFGGRFVLVGAQPDVLVSADGIAWTTLTTLPLTLTRTAATQFTPR